MVPRTLHVVHDRIVPAGAHAIRTDQVSSAEILDAGRRLAGRPLERTGIVGVGLRGELLGARQLELGRAQRLVDEELGALKSVRQLLAGGDVLSIPHIRKALGELNGCHIINGYGPTENTTFTCCHSISDQDLLRTSIPIGRPIFFRFEMRHCFFDFWHVTQVNESGEVIIQNFRRNSRIENVHSSNSI
jgi:long-subunit acyl-CoA synthetase (AMP-forming)